MTTQEQILNFYKNPGPMTSGGKYAAILESLPNEIAALCRIVQGLAIHEFVASSFYGFTVPDDRKSESHIRSVERMLDRIFALSDAPLTVARPPGKRLVGVCHHFMLLLLAMLQAKGIAARARCGFGSYFNPPFLKTTGFASTGMRLKIAGCLWIRSSMSFGGVIRRSIMTFLMYRAIAF